MSFAVSFIAMCDAGPADPPDGPPAGGIKQPCRERWRRAGRPRPHIIRGETGFVVSLFNGVRSALFNIAFFGMTALYCSLVMLPLCLFTGEAAVRRGVYIYCRSSVVLARVLMGIRVEYRGLDNIPCDGAVILAAAHQSNLDPIMTYLVRPDLSALAKKELFRLPVIGLIFKKMGVIKIDRQSGKAHRDMDVVAGEIHAGGRALIVYPQATRVRPGDRRALKAGAYHLGRSAGLTVVPVATNSGLFWTRGFWHRPGHVVFEALPPIDVTLDKDDFMARLRAAVVDRSEALMVEAGYGHVLPED